METSQDKNQYKFKLFQTIDNYKKHMMILKDKRPKSKIMTDEDMKNRK